MRQSKLYEESAVSTNPEKERKAWTAFNILQWAFMIFTIIGVLMSFLEVPILIAAYFPEEGEKSVTGFIIALAIWILGIVFMGALAFCFWRMKLRRSVSYDYIFVEDELRISKVFNGKKRKLVQKIEADRVLKIGYCDRPSFESTAHGYDKKSIKFLTPNPEPAEGKFFFYIVYSSPVEKSLYIIEAREEMLEYLVPAAGMQKFERQ